MTGIIHFEKILHSLTSVTSDFSGLDTVSVTLTSNCCRDGYDNRLDKVLVHKVIRRDQQKAQTTPWRDSDDDAFTKSEKTV